MDAVCHSRRPAFAVPAAAAPGGQLRRGAPDLRRRAAVAGRGRGRAGRLRAPWPRSCPSGAGGRCATPWRRWCASGSSRSPAATRTRTTPTPCAPTRCSSWSAGGCPRRGPTWPASRPSRAWRTRCERRACYRLAAGPGRRLPARAGAGRASRRGSCWTWTGPTTRPTAHQEGTAYHGYYRQHMYHPLLVFDGDTDQLITAVLRPGNAHGAPGRGRRPQAPGARPARRAGRGWPSSCGPTAASPCPPCTPGARRRGSPTPSGWSPTPAWRPLAAPLLADGPGAAGRDRGRRCAWPARPPTRPRAGPRPRRVVFKAEALAKGPNTRFVVTTRADPPAGPLRLLRRPRASRRTGSRTSSAPASPTASATTASGPTSSACSCTPPPTGCWTPCAAGSSPPAPSACSSTPCACACSRSAAGSASCLTRVRLHLASSHPGQPLWAPPRRPPRPAVNNPG